MKTYRTILKYLSVTHTESPAGRSEAHRFTARPDSDRTQGVMGDGNVVLCVWENWRVVIAV